MEHQKTIVFTESEIDYMMEIIGRYSAIPDMKRLLLVLMITIGEQLKNKEITQK